MSAEEDRTGWPRGLAGFDRIWVDAGTSGPTIGSKKQREALEPIILDDELILERHSARSVCLRDAGTDKWPSIYFTDRRVIFLTAFGVFRKTVSVSLFDYDSIDPVVDRYSDQVGDIGITIWNVRFAAPGNVVIVNFDREQERNVFADTLDQRVTTRHA